MVHVFSTDWLDTPNPSKGVSAPRSTRVFGAPEIYLSPGLNSLNDVTTTKQRVTAGTGILAIASTSSHASWGFENLDTDAPTATGISPADDQVGVGLQPTIQVRLTDAGIGVNRNSIVMTLDGMPVTPTLAGTAAEYLLSYTPATPLQQSHIYTVAVTAADNAYPPHTATDNIRFKTEMPAGPLDKKINFQPATGATAPGYDVDSGDGYTLERG